VEIIVAKRAGFCFGVKRALKVTYQTAESTDREVGTLGPLIHNPQVVSRLMKMGVRPVEDAREFHGETLIIRSHGVPRAILKAAEESGIRLVDATCPFVKKAQDYARELNDEGYKVVIVGDKNHPEVQGILSYAGEDAVVAVGERDLSGMKKLRKIGVVAQTTTTFERLKAVVTRCMEISSEIKIYNTICDATHIRQKEAQDIARGVDVMVVVGGKNSGNTTRLAELCRRTGTPTFHIETHEDLDRGWFRGARKVGITAGASTPDWVIKGVEECLKRWSALSA
jgi:(E)-4-hydroxy-3-methyl-but-2-enyl pyrophosphate reductase